MNKYSYPAVFTPEDNGAYSIKHPEARMKPPAHQGFLNDFDSLCLSYPGVHDYIVESMEQIARLVGHSNISMTDHYLHIDTDTLSNVVSVLNTI